MGLKSFRTINDLKKATEQKKAKPGATKVTETISLQTLPEKELRELAMQVPEEMKRRGLKVEEHEAPPMSEKEASKEAIRFFWISRQKAQLEYAIGGMTEDQKKKFEEAEKKLHETLVDAYKAGLTKEEVTETLRKAEEK